MLLLALPPVMPPRVRTLAHAVEEGAFLGPTSFSNLAPQALRLRPPSAQLSSPLTVPLIAHGSLHMSLSSFLEEAQKRALPVLRCHLQRKPKKRANPVL